MHEINIVLLGEGGTGKTTLIERYCQGKFYADTKMTVGYSIFIIRQIIWDKNIKLRIFDIGGQERFRYLVSLLEPFVDGALLFFDLTRAMTLENMAQWVNYIRKSNENLPILFLGTKLDLEGDIDVDDDYALTFKNKYKLSDYLKVSSKTGENVQEAIESLTRQITKSKYQDTGTLEKPLKLIYEFNKDLKLYYKSAESTEAHELDSMINAKELLLMKHSPSLKPIFEKLKILNRHVQNGISFLESLNDVKQHLLELINGLEFSDEIEDIKFLYNMSQFFKDNFENIINNSEPFDEKENTQKTLDLIMGLTCLILGFFNIELDKKRAGFLFWEAINYLKEYDYQLACMSHFLASNMFVYSGYNYFLEIVNKNEQMIMNLLKYESNLLRKGNSYLPSDFIILGLTLLDFISPNNTEVDVVDDLDRYIENIIPITNLEERVRDIAKETLIYIEEKIIKPQIIRISILPEILTKDDSESFNFKILNISRSPSYVTCNFLTPGAEIPSHEIKCMIPPKSTSTIPFRPGRPQNVGKVIYILELLDDQNYLIDAREINLFIGEKKETIRIADIKILNMDEETHKIKEGKKVDISVSIKNLGDIKENCILDIKSDIFVQTETKKILEVAPEEEEVVNVNLGETISAGKGSISFSLYDRDYKYLKDQKEIIINVKQSWKKAAKRGAGIIISILSKI